ncbi:hypothetical protein ABZ027_21825 [Streptomyces sp. NPDC006332]|uniref:hypothetical protein n=1 Tax=Streptomyces sp. NPDC006332 TaxID=3155456 RepID=UPI0033A8EDC1
MSYRSEQAMQTLSRFGELAWFALPAATHPIYGYPQVPYMGWRFKTPGEFVGRIMEDAVTAAPTQLEWTIDRTRRNWLLLPTRILKEAKGVENPAFSNVVHSINTQDQEFCTKALSDFELIIHSLQESSFPES